MGGSALVAINNINRTGFDAGLFLVVTGAIGVSVLCLIAGIWIYRRIVFKGKG
jgi:hypothetical protein